MNGELLECTNENHIWCGSPYPKDKVPYKLFKDEKLNKLYKHCQNCRNYKNKNINLNKNKQRNNQKEQILNNNNFLPCICDSHDSLIYPKDKVPRSLFIKNPNNPNSSLTKFCLNCKNVKAKNSKEKRQLLVIEAEKQGLYYCQVCNNTINQDERANNLDGTLANNCKRCQNKRNEIFKAMKIFFIELKFEYILNNQACCSLCHKIFIIIDNKLCRFDTVLLEDNVRYLNFNNQIYKVSDFIVLYKDIIIHDILHFDHLTEAEQREKKLLTDDQVYEPKKRHVSQSGSKEKMRFEARKCQLVCGECHVMETMRREKGTKKVSQTHDKKMNYVNNLKKEGCYLCHYKNNELPRFFHFDHIEPFTKIANVSEMVHFGKYSFDHVVEEVKKCRIICLHCHMLHTKEQWQSDLYRTKIKKITTTYIEPKKSHCVKIIQYDIKDNFIKEYKSISEAARELKIKRQQLYDILNGKLTHHEFKFERIDK